MIPALRIVGLAFILAWLVHTIVLSGSAVIAYDYSQALHASPMASQEALGKPYQQATVAFSQTLPRQIRVLIVVDQIDIDQEYAQYWTSYWLYPRSVRLTADPAAAATASEEVIVYVQSPGRRAVAAPIGYVVNDIRRYPDGTVVTLLRTDR